MQWFKMQYKHVNEQFYPKSILGLLNPPLQVEESLKRLYIPFLGIFTLNPSQCVLWQFHPYFQFTESPPDVIQSQFDQPGENQGKTLKRTRMKFLKMHQKELCIIYFTYIFKSRDVNLSNHRVVLKIVTAINKTSLKSSLYVPAQNRATCLN